MNSGTTSAARSTTTPVTVLANQTNPNTLTAGGIAEFDTLANPVVAFQGSDSTDPDSTITYSWAFGDGGTSTDADPSHNGVPAASSFSGWTPSSMTGSVSPRPAVRTAGRVPSCGTTRVTESARTGIGIPHRGAGTAGAAGQQVINKEGMGSWIG